MTTPQDELARAIESGQPLAPIPRLKITSLVGGGHEVRVSYAEMTGFTSLTLAAALISLTIGAERIRRENVGQPIDRPHQRRWIIPITKGSE